MSTIVRFLQTRNSFRPTRTRAWFFSLFIALSLAMMIPSTTTRAADDLPPPPDAADLSSPPAPPPDADAQTPDQESDGKQPEENSSDGATPPTVSESEDSEKLPEIEAKTYRLKTVKASSSGQVYLVDVTHAGSTPLSPPPPTSDDEAPADPKKPSLLPAVGRLLLLRNPTDSSNVMAMRVLKDRPDLQQIIVKRVRTYEGGPKTLSMDASFKAIEKISDVVPPPPTAQDIKDVKEVEPAPPPFEPELDAASSPAPADNEKNAGNDEEKEDEDEMEARISRGVSEEHAYKTRYNIISIGTGLFRNTPDFNCATSDINGNCTGGTYSSKYFFGGGARYGYTFAENIFRKKGSSVGDSMSLEGGLFLYKILNLTGQGDSYSVMPLLGTLRYNLVFSEYWTFFVYGGVVQNVVLEASPPTDTTTNPTSSTDYTNKQKALARLQPAGGIGALFEVGPQWYGRIEIGIDAATIGLGLTF